MMENDFKMIGKDVSGWNGEEKKKKKKKPRDSRLSAGPCWSARGCRGWRSAERSGSASIAGWPVLPRAQTSPVATVGDVWRPAEPPKNQTQSQISSYSNQ